MKKRILATLLALCLCLALLPVTALAAVEFQTTDGVLVKYNGSGGDVVIPSGVTGIGKNAFSGCKNLTSVTIPEGVTSIGDGAFSGCSSLTSVTVPRGVVSIEKGAFGGCTGLTSVTIPEGVTSIGERAFQECVGLTTITIPDGVTSIGKLAFWYCKNLTGVNIPNSVTYLGEQAFSDCFSLASLTIGNGVNRIRRYTFDNCSSLTNVTIPDSVTIIEYSVFNRCNGLTSVTIPASVADIWNNAFASCDKLSTILGAEGSYAQLWAMDEGYDFEATLPAAATPGKTAYASTQSILVNGTPVEFQSYALKDKNGNATNYVKLRDVALVLNGTSAQFNVGWDGQAVTILGDMFNTVNGRVTITTGEAYTPNGSEMKTPYSGDRTYANVKVDLFHERTTYEPESGYVLLNGSNKSMSSLLLKDAEGNGYTYFKLRDLGKALGFKVDWSADKGIFIETN